MKTHLLALIFAAVSCLSQETVTIFKGPVDSLPDINYYGKSCVLDDTTLVWAGPQGQYDWRLNTRTLAWTYAPEQGVEDPYNRLYMNTPLLDPDGTWTYFSTIENRVYRKHPDGTREVMADVSDLQVSLPILFRHPSGLIGGTPFFDTYLFIWPRENVKAIRIPPGSDDNNSVAWFREGDMAAVKNDYRWRNGIVSTVSRDLGRTWDTLFCGPTGLESDPSVNHSPPFAWGRYVAYQSSDGFTFLDKFTKAIHIYPQYFGLGEVLTPDTVYGSGGCGFYRLRTDTSFYRGGLPDTICQYVDSTGLHIHSQRNPVQLNDGRIFMHGIASSVHTLWSTAVRPFRVMDIEVRCDTLRFRLRGDRRKEATIKFSKYASMLLLGFTDEGSSRLYTYQRLRAGNGALQMYVDYMTLHDTLHFPNMRSYEISKQRLRRSGTEALPVLSCEQDSNVAMIHWYKDGKPVDGIDYGKQSSFRLTVTEPGTYHAHIMTTAWCETTTDTVDVVPTGVAGDVDFAGDGQMIRTVIAYDILGREVQRLEIDDISEVHQHRWQLPIGFVLMFNTRGGVVARKRVVDGWMR